MKGGDYKGREKVENSTNLHEREMEEYKSTRGIVVFFEKSGA